MVDESWRIHLSSSVQTLVKEGKSENKSSLETSLARMVTPKTAAKQATVKTDPTTTAAFMLLTEPSTLESCPLREDMVDLLSASMSGFKLNSYLFGVHVG